MNMQHRLMWLVVLVPAVLWACSAVEVPTLKRLGDNKYVFVVIPKGALITPQQFQFATMQARAFCERSGLKHMVSVEPDSAIESGQDVYHFSCEPADSFQYEALQ